MPKAIVQYHEAFARQFAQLIEDVAADVATLIEALENHGHHIEGTDHTADPAHPIITSNLDLWALRRTPPTGFTPGATNPPVLRIPYAWMSDDQGREYALGLFIGDKTVAGNRWYPAAVRKIENELLPRWQRSTGHTPRRRRRRP